jgi:hypothetical protein
MFKNRQKLVVSALLSSIVLFVLHFIAMENSWYFLYFWFDILMHVFGGFTITLALFLILERIPFAQMMSQTYFLFLVLFFLFVAGAAWEVFEYWTDILFLKIGFDSIDTFADLVNDMFGSFIAMWYIFRK